MPWRIALLGLGILAVALPASVGHAQQAIDDVLEGFDEEPALPAGPNGDPKLERDLEGFDDMPAGPGAAGDAIGRIVEGIAGKSGAPVR